MTESPETQAARRDWTLNAIGEKLSSVDRKFDEHIASDEKHFRALNNRLLGNPDHPQQKGLQNEVIDMRGDVTWLKNIGAWVAGIFAAVVGGIIIWVATK